MGRLNNVRSPKKAVKTVNIVWADVNGEDLKDLRKKILEVMTRPNQAFVSNHEIHWYQIQVNPKSNKRIVWANIPKSKVGDLTKQVEKALADPNYVIVTGYDVHWIELD